MKFSKKIVTACITILVLYAIFQMILSCVFMTELMPTLTQWVYTVFGIELCACAAIRIFDREVRELDIEDERKRREEEGQVSLRETAEEIIAEYNQEY